jgi:hypothetical protein
LQATTVDARPEKALHGARPTGPAEVGSFDVHKRPHIFIVKLKEFAMKNIASGLLVLGLLAVQVSEANAAACAAGPYRAGCVGPRGAVGVHRGYGYGYHPGYGYHGGAAVVRRPGAVVVRRPVY